MSFGNHGCQGGDIYNAYQYILANEGVDTSNGYPYRGRVSQCSTISILSCFCFFLFCSNIHAAMIQNMLVLRYQGAFG